MDQSDLYAKAFAELASIDAQISALEKRRIPLRQFVELGQKLFAINGEVNLKLPSLQMSASGTTGAAPSAAREQSLKARVLALSRQAIQEHGALSTAALVDYIESAGVTVTGAHKPTTVSVILSRSDEFQSDRKLGWVLIEPAQKELTPQDVAASAGSSTA